MAERPVGQGSFGIVFQVMRSIANFELTVTELLFWMIVGGNLMLTNIN